MEAKRIGEALDEVLDAVDLSQAIDTGDFKRFLDRLPIAVGISRQVGNAQRVVYANAAFEQLTGLVLAELSRDDGSALDVYLGEDDPGFSLGRAVMAEEDYFGAFRRRDDQSALIEASVAVINDEGGGPAFRLLALVNISGRERSLRDELEKHLRDKDLLLKELQHRVKNSLQIITALIRLEARNAREGKPIDFDSVAGRIEALSLLYLAMSESLSETVLDLGNYLGQIASACLRSHATESVRFDLKVESCPVSINVAMPAGLIVNEVITNALKHAFAGRDSGTLTLHCLREGDFCRVLVADDGIGLPAGVVWPPDGKISALIVQSLHENAKTEVRVDSKPGHGTRIAFLVPLLVQGETDQPAWPRRAGPIADGRGESAALAGS